MACELRDVCGTPGNQTVDELDSWNQYGAWYHYPPPLFVLCSSRNRASFYVQINTGSWINCDASTPIKLVSGAQGQSVASQGQVSCNASSTPRASWVLQANTGSGGSSYSMRIKGTYVYTGYYYFTITVNAAGTDVTVTPGVTIGAFTGLTPTVTAETKMLLATKFMLLESETEKRNYIKALIEKNIIISDEAEKILNMSNRIDKDILLKSYYDNPSLFEAKINKIAGLETPVDKTIVTKSKIAKE